MASRLAFLFHLNYDIRVRRSHGKDGVLRLIAIFKLAKGMLLIAIAFGALTLFNHELGDVLGRFAEQFKIDPGNKYFQALTGKLSEIQPRLPLVAIGTFCYGAIFAVEGVGLLRRKRWAEWLTVVVTGSFIPFEIYEIAKHQTVTKGLVLLLNATIFVYLIVRLKKERKQSCELQK